MPTAPENTIAFQGEPGAYSDLSCREVFPAMTPLACATFEDSFAAVASGAAKYAMIPIENSLAGRVADNHHLLPESGLFIVGEHFHRVKHQLLGVPGATLAGLKKVLSHPQALGQCRKTLRALGVVAESYVDTAGAARRIAERGDPAIGAIASALAGEIHGLAVLKADLEDAAHNTTRFLIMARQTVDPPAEVPCMTTFVFEVRNVPAALYKALGGFATNGVNMTKLESYQLGGSFTATQFYADVEGRPSDRNVQLALEELDFFTHRVKILGVYPRHPDRGKYAVG